MEEQVTIKEYHRKVLEAREQNPEWRLGQAYFNVLYELRPEIAEQVRATAIDSFYTRDQKEIEKFLLFLEEHWDDNFPEARAGEEVE